MRKYNKLPENIIDLLPKAQAYLKAHPKVVFAYLFGGIARGKLTPLSDVDIAIYISKDADILEQKMEILGELMEQLETDEIDLVMLNTASLPLRARIIANKRVIIDKDPFLRHKFESLTLRKYFDFSIKEMDILKRRYSIGR